MSAAKSGDTVKVHYTGKLDNGTVFDTSSEREPIQFKIGEQHVIPGFENAVVGMAPGEKKTIKIVCQEAYGPHAKELITVVDRAQFPEHITPTVGQQLEIENDEGFQAIVTITEVNDASVTIDANHPLAGKDLTFDIQLVEIA